MPNIDIVIICRNQVNNTLYLPGKTQNVMLALASMHFMHIVYFFQILRNRHFKQIDTGKKRCWLVFISTSLTTLGALPSGLHGMGAV